jgi:hypothetical protein
MLRSYFQRCLFHKSTASSLEFSLGTPGSSPAPEATLEHGDPREHWHRTYETNL